MGRIVDPVVCVLAVFMALAVLPLPPTGFMGEYTPREHWDYWQIFLAVWLPLFALSAGLHLTLRGTLGQRARGLWLVQDDGFGPPTRGQLLGVAALRQAPVVLVFGTGPLLGLLFGPDSNLFALVILIAALGLWPYWLIAERPSDLMRVSLMRIPRDG